MFLGNKTGHRFRSHARGFYCWPEFPAGSILVQIVDMARPPYKPTAADRRKVAVAAAGGMAHEDIALALGIARGTLLKHFDQELSTGAAEKRLAILNQLYATGMKGNVAAMKAYLAASPEIGAPAPEAEKPVKKGKKEQADDDAKTAQVGTEWGDLLPGATVRH